MAAMQTTLRDFPAWRQGQTYFNVLASERPDLSEQIRGSVALDPFHKSGDDLVPFFEWVSTKW